MARASYLRVHLFRRDDKQRLAAIDTGVPASAFTPVSFQQMTVYRQDPATLGEDRYLLTNPAGLSARTTGWETEFRTQWRAATLQASFMADKAEAPANPGNAAIENDPGVLGALFLDPNTSINTTGRTFNDRQYVARVQATWQLPRRWGGLETSSIADYFGGIPLASQMLVTGLPQGPFVAPLTARGDNGGYRSDAAMNWNLRVMREFRLPFGTLGAIADVLNVANGGQKSEVAIQEPRSVRLQLRYEF